MFGRQKETHMNLQTLLDREEIIDLISTYNKASFYCDLKGYADTFTPDGRYINANHGWALVARRPRMPLLLNTEAARDSSTVWSFSSTLSIRTRLL